LHLSEAQKNGKNAVLMRVKSDETTKVRRDSNRSRLMGISSPPQPMPATDSWSADFLSDWLVRLLIAALCKRKDV
jgi:hypothetical protein